MKRTAAESLPVSDADDVVIVEISLRSRRFASRIEVPLYASDEAKRAFVESWLALMQTGLKLAPRKRKRVTPTTPEEDPSA